MEHGSFWWPCMRNSDSLGFRNRLCLRRTCEARRLTLAMFFQTSSVAPAVGLANGVTGPRVCSAPGISSYPESTSDGRRTRHGNKQQDGIRTLRQRSEAARGPWHEQNADVLARHALVGTVKRKSNRKTCDPTCASTIRLSSRLHALGR